MYSVHTFGGFYIEIDSQIVSRTLGDMPSEILSYLILNSGIPRRREKLFETFYPGKTVSEASSCLNTTLWRLKKWLQKEKLWNYISFDTTNSSLIGNCEKPNIDVFQLQKVYDQGDISPGNIESTKFVAEAYHGPFLEGHDSDWIYFERERLDTMYIDLLHRLGRYYLDNGNYEQAVITYKRILFNDPMREYIHRELMAIFAISGQRVKAIQQYQECERIIRKELKISPMQATIDVFEEIKSGEIPAKEFSFSQ